MLVVGIDPGSSKTGFAWIQKKNGITRRAVCSIISSEPFPDRYIFLQKRLETALGVLPEEPVMIAVEKNQLPEGDFSLEQVLNQVHLEGAYSVACTVVHRLFPKSLINPIPTRVWRGPGNKIDTLGKMHMRYGLIFDNDDEADALGIADYVITYVWPSESVRPQLHTVVQTGQTKLIVPPGESFAATA
jgi:hypothetical protein